VSSGLATVLATVTAPWLIPDCFRPDISPVGADHASVMRCCRSLLLAAGRCCCCHRCCQPHRTAGIPAPWSSSPPADRRRHTGPGCVLLRPLPRTRLLPNLVTDGFGQGRLRVYMKRAALPGAVGLRSQTGLTGSGSHGSSYGGFGGRYPHFHSHTAYLCITSVSRALLAGSKPALAFKFAGWLLAAVVGR
jgi:hypothetical protein